MYIRTGFFVYPYLYLMRVTPKMVSMFNFQLAYFNNKTKFVGILTQTGNIFYYIIVYAKAGETIAICYSVIVKVSSEFEAMIKTHLNDWVKLKQHD